jgi:hypothetical protein
MSEEVKEHRIKTRNPDGVIQDIVFIPTLDEGDEVCVFTERCSCTPDETHFNLIYHDKGTEIQIASWQFEERAKEAMDRIRKQLTTMPFFGEAFLPLASI